MNNAIPSDYRAKMMKAIRRRFDDAPFAEHIKFERGTDPFTWIARWSWGGTWNKMVAQFHTQRMHILVMEGRP